MKFKKTLCALLVVLAFTAAALPVSADRPPLPPDQDIAYEEEQPIILFGSSVINANDLTYDFVGFRYIEGNTVYNLTFSRYGNSGRLLVRITANVNVDKDSDVAGVWESVANVKEKPDELIITTNKEGSLPNQTFTYDSKTHDVTVTKTAVVSEEKFAAAQGAVFSMYTDGYPDPKDGFDLIGSEIVQHGNNAAGIGLTAETNGTTSVKLSWDKIPGAEKYKIYLLKDDMLDGYEKGKYGTVLFYPVATTAKTSYTVKGLKPSTQYAFKVAPVGSDGSVGKLSAPAVAVTAAAGKVSAKDLSYKKFSQKWNAYNGDSTTNDIQFDGNTKTAWIVLPELPRAAAIKIFSYGKYTTKVKSDTQLEIKVDTSGNLEKAKTFIFDKSKNTLSETTNGTPNAQTDVYRFAAYMSDGGSLFFNN